MSSVADTRASPRTRQGVGRFPLRLVSASKGWYGVAALLYLGFALFLTWPLPLHLSTSLYASAPNPGDPIGTVSFFRDLVADHRTPFLPGTLHQIAAPEGQPIAWVRDIASAPAIALEWLLALAFGPIAGFGLYALVGYVSTGLAMFALMRRLLRNTWVALLCGWAYAFYPFATINGQGHVDYIYGSVLVLAMWRMLELLWAPTRRNAAWATLATGLSLWWTPYFILIWGVGFVATALASVLIAWREKRLRQVARLEAAVIGLIVVFLGALAALSTSTSGQSLGVRSNDLAEFNTYSARPLEYLVPDARNPIIGSHTASYLMAHIHGSNPSESTLYVGVTVVALAIVGLLVVLFGRASTPVRQAVIVVAFVGVVAAVFSAPPQATIFGVTLDFPAHFVMKITTTWRVFSRFVILIMLCATVLAGVGLDWLARRRAMLARYGILAAVSAAVVLDLWSRLPQRTWPTVRPSVFNVLARQPGTGLVAEYPLLPNGSNFYWDVYFQAAYHKPIINGYLTGSLEEHRALALSNLARSTTAGRLAALGVRYIVVERGPVPYGLAAPGTPGRGFKRIAEDAFADLYAVTAKPAGPALPALGSQFGDDETAADGTVSSWLEQPSGEISFTGRCAGCQGVVRMTLTSFARPRLVTISGNGRTLWRQRVAAATRVAIPITYGDIRSLQISATPGPQSIRATTGADDPRSVSVNVAGLSFTFPRRDRR